MIRTKNNSWRMTINKQIPHLLFLLFVGMNVVFGQNANKALQLTSSIATLNIDKAGVLTIKNSNTKNLIAKTSIQDFWGLSIQNKKETTILSPKIYSFQPSKNVEIKKEGNEIFVIYNEFMADDRKLPVQAIFKISLQNEAFVFSAQINSQSEEWLLRELTYPIFTDIAVDKKNTKVFWPNGLGQCFNSPGEFNSQSFDYPGGTGTMQWFSINKEANGLYIGSHDAEKTKKRFTMVYSDQKGSFKTGVQLPVYNNQYSSPEILFRPYKGSWHIAANIYRNWFSSAFVMPQIPDWVKKDAGWLLAILKQQNGHVMWSYKDIDKLCDLAVQRNLTTIGLFGWANGGHDNLFPNFIPDNLMGGKQELKDAIKRAQGRGIKIVLYANAFIFDVSTEYYRYNGNEVAVMQENQNPNLLAVRKYFNATPVIFAKASPGSTLWRKTMHGLALQANELGANGILYDQMGVAGPELDFSKFREQQLPQDAFTKYRYLMLNEIRSNLKKINPDFVIMTEATNDAVITDIDYHHGWGIGTAIDPIGFNGSLHSFPSLFRYTFPELVETQRNANPMLTRSEANFAAVYGLRHEIECRYDEDVNYLTRDEMPDSGSYANVSYYPPVAKKIIERPVSEATKYMHDLIQFENLHAEFFRYGKFIDEEGFTVTGQDIVAKGFLNGRKLGIIVWNTHETEDRTFNVVVPGYDLLESKQLSMTLNSEGSLVKANSLQLLLYAKSK